MKTKKLLLTAAILILNSTLFIFNCSAQYTKLLDFGNAPSGSTPLGSLISEGAFQFGMTQQGGTYNLGVLFKIKPDGTGYSKLLDFTGVNGSNPVGSLISDGTFLYGMTDMGGTNDMGVIFKIKPDGTGYSKLLDFTGIVNGSNPTGSFISDGTFLYGMTSAGGINSYGVIFKIKPDGTGYSKLLDFNWTNNGGITPNGSLISEGTFLYGMTTQGGINNDGTIFKIKPDGTGYANLLDFDGTNGSYPYYGSLISDGTFLYGMTNQGGINAMGTIFKIKPDGTGYSKLLDFAGSANGAFPNGSLISDGTFLYGMTSGGDSNTFYGVVFKIKPDGTGYANLLDFAGANGDTPNGSLISDGTFLYGMTSAGGTSNIGVTFKIKPDGTGFSKLLDFANVANGSIPNGSLISVGTSLYGMAQGGINALGTIFKINPDGTGYTDLLDFNGTNGSNPKGDLISDGTFLYGMTSLGGTHNFGTIFKIKPDGTGYSKLLDFLSPLNGNSPLGSLFSDGTYLYGMTSNGGTNGDGTVFKIKPDGTGYSKLLDFTGTANGRAPNGSLISDGTFLYGMTSGGGTNNDGTIFKIMPDGTGYIDLLDFVGTANGSAPIGSLISDGTFLYGITSAGGTNGKGVIFKIMPDGTGYANLLNFTGANGSSPGGSLIFEGTFLYGMTTQGGTNNDGTIFKIKPDGTGYADLLDFAGTTNGSSPAGSLISDGTFLYGMTEWGGTSTACTNGCGTIFKTGLATGITEYNSASAFSVYPNPSNGNFNLIINQFDNLKMESIVIYNVLGEKIYQSKINNPKSEIDLSNQAKGIYFIQIIDENKNVINKKIIIQ